MKEKTGRKREKKGKGRKVGKRRLGRKRRKEGWEERG